MEVENTYRGGHASLGTHGRHFRLEDGRLGFGEFKLTHGIPLSDVGSIEVTKEQFGGSEAQTLLSMGTVKLGSTRGSPGSEPAQVTLVTVCTREGQEPVWEVEDRGADWVRERLTPVLRRAGVRHYDGPSPQERQG